MLIKIILLCLLTFQFSFADDPDRKMKPVRASREKLQKLNLDKVNDKPVDPNIIQGEISLAQKENGRKMIEKAGKEPRKIRSVFEVFNIKRPTKGPKMIEPASSASPQLSDARQKKIAPRKVSDSDSEPSSAGSAKKDSVLESGSGTTVYR